MKTISDETNTDMLVEPYPGSERRTAGKPRRAKQNRRHRVRSESLISECRSQRTRRKEDEEGFIEISNLYDDE